MSALLGKLQGIHGRGIGQFRLPRQQREPGEIQVELRAGQRIPGVEKYHLVDDAEIPLAAGDAETRARGLGARLRGRQRVGRRAQPVQGLLDLQLDLPGGFLAADRRLPGNGAGRIHARANGAAVEDRHA